MNQPLNAFYKIIYKLCALQPGTTNNLYTEKNCKTPSIHKEYNINEIFNRLPKNINCIKEKSVMA